MEQPAPKIDRRGYHHGNLTEALVTAAVALIEERGVEALSVREVAKHAGVSPGAPFRHFDSKTALLTAVAEQAMERFVAAVDAALADWPANDPVGALKAMGHAYLDWAMANPVHFRIISSRELIDFAGSRQLVESNSALRAAMRHWLEAARDAGLLRRSLEIELALLNCRAFVYGLARMWCDGHLGDWQGDRAARAAADLALESFIDSLASSA